MVGLLELHPSEGEVVVDHFILGAQEVQLGEGQFVQIVLGDYPVVVVIRIRVQAPLVRP